MEKKPGSDYGAAAAVLAKIRQQEENSNSDAQPAVDQRTLTEAERQALRFEQLKTNTKTVN